MTYTSVFSPGHTLVGFPQKNWNDALKPSKCAHLGTQRCYEPKGPLEVSWQHFKGLVYWLMTVSQSIQILQSFAFTLCNRPFLDCKLMSFVSRGLPFHKVKIRFLRPKTPRQLGDSLEDNWLNTGEDDEEEDNNSRQISRGCFTEEKSCFSRVHASQNTCDLPMMPIKKSWLEVNKSNAFTQGNSNFWTNTLSTHATRIWTCLDETEGREIMEDFFNSSHGTQVIFAPLSSHRAPIFQQRGPWDSLRQNHGENTDTAKNNSFERCLSPIN